VEGEDRQLPGRLGRDKLTLFGGLNQQATSI
jgi:hypothetical protein